MLLFRLYQNFYFDAPPYQSIPGVRNLESMNLHELGFLCNFALYC